MSRLTGVFFKSTLAIILITTTCFVSLVQVSHAWAAGGQSGNLSRLESVLQPIVKAAAEDGIELYVGVQDLSNTYGGGKIQAGSSNVYYAASTIKMAIVTALMQDIEAGKYVLEQTVQVKPEQVVGGAGSLKEGKFPQEITIERLAGLMITQSDNTATNALIDLLGFERINALIDEQGFETMQLGRKMMTPAKSPAADNYVNGEELLTLLERIYAGEIVSAQSRDQILAWMKAQEVKTKFGVALPGKPIAHKTGELGDVSHDIGYFLVPGREVAVTVLTKVTKPEDAGKAQELGNPVVQRAAKAVYNFLLDTPAEVVSADAWPALSLAVNPIIREAGDKGIRVAVGLKDLSGRDRELLLGSRQSYMPASTIKMALVSALMKEVDAGRLTLEQKVKVEQEDVVGGTGSLQKETFPQDVTIERLARLMITQSDNTATNVLIDVVGLNKVQALLDELGLDVMHLGRKMFAAAPTPEQDNYINAEDLVHLLANIHSGEFLSDNSRDQIIDWMKAQEVDTKFGAALPDAPIAHKTGENANVTHDAGYFLQPGREIAISVLTEVTTTSSFDEAQAIGNPVVQEIAKAVYQALEHETTFTDVPEDHWAAPYIEGAAAASLVKGISETTFAPEHPISRAEVTSMLARSLQLEPALFSPQFRDVPGDQWYSADVTAAYSSGIVSGRNDGIFHPQGPISRAELAAMIIRAYEYVHGPLAEYEDVLSLKDANEIRDWSRESILKAVQLGFVNGYSDDTFRPDRTASRAETLKMIVHLLSK
ncbi:serine hydrolase [Paenibacillus sp. FSL W7-1279]|uniref:serine hydrolase n=1 Tax=Paenibacillus sp. FSL W7-1279 TaxID=2921697 RepID=UPI0030D9A9FC